MPTITNILGFSLIALFVYLIIYSNVESTSFSPTLWRRGLIVFRQVIKKPVTPVSSLMGRETIFNGVIAKLIDERTCLFREEPIPRQPMFPFLGEIRFGPKGYLVLARLQWSKVLLLFIIIFNVYLALFRHLTWFSGLIFWLACFVLALISVALIFSALLLVYGDRLSNVYPKVIDWAQSGKVSNRLDYSISKDTLLSCSICGGTADIVCKHCHKPFCERHIRFYNTSYERISRYWVGYFCNDCQRGHEETWQGMLKVWLALMVLIVIATTIAYIKDLFLKP